MTPPAQPATRLNRATSSAGPVPVANLPNRPDAVGELRFKVELPGVDLGRFRECTGLAAEIECKDYNEGGVNDHVHKLPTRMKYPNLVLKRGVTVRAWAFMDAYPIKWTGPNMNASSNQIATEALEIVHAGLQMQAGV